MINGKLYIDNFGSMERLVTLLAENGYTVQIKQIEGIDVFDREYEIKYKREDEYND